MEMRELKQDCERQNAGLKASVYSSEEEYAKAARTVEELHSYQNKREVAHLDNLTALSTDHSIKIKHMSRANRQSLQAAAANGIASTMHRIQKGQTSRIIYFWKRSSTEFQFRERRQAQQGLSEEVGKLRAAHLALEGTRQSEAESIAASMRKDSRELARLRALSDTAAGEKRALSQEITRLEAAFAGSQSELEAARRELSECGIKSRQDLRLAVQGVKLDATRSAQSGILRENLELTKLRRSTSAMEASLVAEEEASRKFRLEEGDHRTRLELERDSLEADLREARATLEDERRFPRNFGSAEDHAREVALSCLEEEACDLRERLCLAEGGAVGAAEALVGVRDEAFLVQRHLEESLRSMENRAKVAEACLAAAHASLQDRFPPAEAEPPATTTMTMTTRGGGDGVGTPHRSRGGEISAGEEASAGRLRGGGMRPIDEVATNRISSPHAAEDKTAAVAATAAQMATLERDNVCLEEELALLRGEMDAVRGDALFYVEEYEREAQQRKALQGELNHTKLAMRRLQP